MTNERYTIGKGRLHFDDSLFGPPPSLLRKREQTFKAEFRTDPLHLAHLAAFFGRDPIPHIVGYDPQLLLPHHEPRQWGDDDFATPLDYIRRWRIAVIDADRVTRKLLARTANIEGLVGVVINIDAPSGEIGSPLFEGPPIFRDYVSPGPMPTRTYHNDLMDIVPEPRKRQPDYLKHDPSKRHGRGRRRR